MNLLIVESPTKVKKIKAILGDGWQVAASVGHVRDLPISGDLGVSKTTYEPHYTFTERGERVVEALKNSVSHASHVYLATDPDREGEAIAWHLKESLGLTRYSRVSFDSITEKVIRAGIAAPRQLNMNLVRAQEARRVADRLVGYQVSPAISRQANADGLKLSAGRVQSVALRLVVERQREIDSFVSTNHFGAEALFSNGAWRAEWDTNTFLPEGSEYILDSALAAKAATCKEFKVTASTTATVSQAPPPPFNTATLLQAASVRLKISPAETAAIAQKLFGQGLITYHRTDSVNLSDEAVNDLKAFVGDKYPLPNTPRRWKNKDSAQEAHEAIRPTHFDQADAGEDALERSLYKLIWERAVTSQLADATYTENKLTLSADLDGQQFVFRAVGRTPIDLGWRAMTPKDTTEEDDADSAESGAANLVPPLPVGSVVSPSSTRVLSKRTRAPKAYTQASLIKKLEHEGIGRPSTYHTILKNILAREYIRENKQLLTATELGAFLIDLMVGRFTFLNYDYTRRLEKELDDIDNGGSQYLTVVSALDAALRVELDQLEAAPKNNAPIQAGAGNGTVCPKCKTGHIRQPKGQKFFGCSRFKEGCKFTIYAEKGGKKLTPNQIEALCRKGLTNVLKGFKSSAGKTFEARLVCNEETNWRVEYQFQKHQ